jgi:hypothetical protein
MGDSLLQIIKYRVYYTVSVKEEKNGLVVNVRALT